jgi:predicted nucleic acid-binding protein
MSEFVDTNVLLYAYAPDAGQKQEISIELLRRLTVEQEGTLSIQVFSEFYHNARRKFRMSAASAEEAIRDFSTWRLHRPDQDSILSAIRLERRYQLAWFDAMILNSAIESGCSILWTEDFQDGQRFGDLVIRNPYKNARAV